MEVFQQKGSRISIHLQKAVEAELERLQKEGHHEKLEEIGENICVNPAVIARKCDKSIKIALDAKELNKRIIRKRMQMPNLDELKDRISIEITRDPNSDLWITTIDPKYSFGQVKLAKNTAKRCVIAIVGGKATGNYQFTCISGLGRLASCFPREIRSKFDK